VKRLGVIAAQVIEKYTQEDEEEGAMGIFSMDDKANVNVEEPHLAVSFGRRLRSPQHSADERDGRCR
jgi:hypothetical protein